MPAAQAFIRERRLNEVVPGELDEVGVIVMGGLTNGLLRALERLGLADAFGASRLPILVLNVVYPLVPEELRAFCAGKGAVLVVEEGHPEYIEQAANVELRRADIANRIFGKGPLSKAREYTAVCCSKASPRPAPPHGRPVSMPMPSWNRCAAFSAVARALPRLSASCQRGRRHSAPAARNARCSVHSSSSSASSARPTSAPTSAATRSRPCRRSRMGKLDSRLRHVARERARPRSVRICRNARSR